MLISNRTRRRLVVLRQIRQKEWSWRPASLCLRHYFLRLNLGLFLALVVFDDDWRDNCSIALRRSSCRSLFLLCQEDTLNIQVWNCFIALVPRWLVLFYRSQLMWGCLFQSLSLALHHKLRHSLLHLFRWDERGVLASNDLGRGWWCSDHGPCVLFLDLLTRVWEQVAHMSRIGSCFSLGLHACRSWI